MRDAASGLAERPGLAGTPARLLLAFAALVSDTVREAFARRIVWGIYGSSAFVLAFLAFVLEIDIVSGAKATITLFGQEAMSTGSVERLNEFIGYIQGAIAAFLYAVSTFIGVFVCAGLSAAIFEAGRAELLLARPLPRGLILLARYTGSVLMVALNVLLLIGGSYLILGAKSGFWNLAFLWAIPITCFLFSVLMALVLLVAVVAENAAVAMIVTFVAMVFSPILAQNDLAIRLLPSQFARNLWKAGYLVLPKVYELGAMLLTLVRGDEVESWLPVTSSAAFAAAALALAWLLFARRDH
ncbi:MAG: ABC transporter permease [Bryobacterales bacterium]|nr:ABC transporter permease [Bryobacterales bacterium]